MPSLKSDDLQSKVDEYLRSKVAIKKFGGKVLVARGDDVLIRRDYGLTGAEHGALSSSRRFRFPVGAIAEQFVAVAVLQLEEQGKIKINASICNYVPNCPSDWKDIQVVHLLTHTSGLPSLEQPFSDQVNLPPLPLREIIAAMARQPLQFKPGSRFNYSWLDFVVLCLAVQNAAGSTPKEYIETEVFHALKMTDTGCLSATLEQASNDPLKPELKKSSNRAEKGPHLCDGRSYSTVEDLYRFDRAVETGAIISHDSLVQMLTPYRDGHGIGWKINKEFDKRLALQSGQSDGISVSVRLYPDDHTYIVLVANGSSIDSVELTHDIAAILFGKRYPGSGSVVPSSIPVK